MRRWVVLLLALAGCGEPSTPEATADRAEFPPAHFPMQELMDAQRRGDDLEVDLPWFGPVTIRAMDHTGARDTAPTWVERDGGWACCHEAPQVLAGHGQAFGFRDSSLELRLVPAGLEGVIGLPQATPAGHATGTYLLQFELTQVGGSLRQVVWLEAVDCLRESDHTWIYGCGSHVRLREGEMAPMA